ncbi:MAG: NAD-dependent epimerase/dehydratase family protein [Bacteroidales bacterium]|nr:NAD-dependent epimerase/dehydratase family protein [Bacteroidales bacterium]
MKVLVTGSAGFIGFHLVKALCAKGYDVLGIDNLNAYYDLGLKKARLTESGIDTSVLDRQLDAESIQSALYDNYRFMRLDLADREGMEALFSANHFDVVVNLAAQAGVRYSIENPHAYVDSNVTGFINILEGCRRGGVGHLVYASSSSVYGRNSEIPFRETDRVDTPVSVYAATKRCDELLAGVYSHLYDMPVTGLRFFTVYGPWGRPDMSPYLFMDAILSGRPLKVFNNGDMWRDFTYVGDIVEGVISVMEVIPDGPERSRLYNIGNQTPVRLLDYIECIERATGRKAIKELLPMQPGDVYRTYADSSALERVTGFRPATPLQEGIDRTVEWFRSYTGL